MEEDAGIRIYDFVITKLSGTAKGKGDRAIDGSAMCFQKNIKGTDHPPDYHR